MLSLRTDQMDALKDQRELSFVESLCAMLAERFAGLHASHEARQRFVREAMAEARTQGLASRADLRSWVQLRAAHGADFTRQPWAAAVLADRALTPSERLSLLVERAVFMLRAAAPGRPVTPRRLQPA